MDVCDSGRVHHRFGSLECFDDALPLGRQTEETPLDRVEGRVHPVLEVPGRGDLQPPLLLLLPQEHPDSLRETRVGPIVTRLAPFLQSHSQHVLDPTEEMSVKKGAGTGVTRAVNRTRPFSNVFKPDTVSVVLHRG